MPSTFHTGLDCINFHNIKVESYNTRQPTLQCEKACSSQIQDKKGDSKEKKRKNFQWMYPCSSLTSRTILFGS